MPTLIQYNTDFFKKWSSDMSYVLGFLFADGNMTITKRGSCFIAFYNSDKKLLESIRNSMNSKHKISKRVVSAGNVYRIQIGSKEMFKDLQKLKLTPNKTKRMELPKIKKEFWGDFLRGFFDGDGNVWMGKIHKNRTKSTFGLQVCLTSSSFNFLSSIHQKLKREGLVGGSLYIVKNKECGRLSFSTNNALKLYEIMYNIPHTLFLKRKRRVFEDFLKMRP